MSGGLSQLLRLAGRSEWHRFEAAADDPDSAHRELWADISQACEGSPFWGKRWGPSGAPALDELPLTEYADYQPAFEAAFDSTHSPTTGEPIMQWTETSGTSANTPKRFPLTAGWDRQSRVAWMTFIHSLSRAAQLPLKPLLMLFSAGLLGSSPAGVPVGLHVWEATVQRYGMEAAADRDSARSGLTARVLGQVRPSLRRHAGREPRLGPYGRVGCALPRIADRPKWTATGPCSKAGNIRPRPCRGSASRAGACNTSDPSLKKGRRASGRSGRALERWLAGPPRARVASLPLLEKRRDGRAPYSTAASQVPNRDSPPCRSTTAKEGHALHPCVNLVELLPRRRSAGSPKRDSRVAS